MPRLNLRAVPTMFDADEEPLRDAARDAGYAMQFDSLARRSGLPHLKLFAHGDRLRVVASFKRGREGLRWLEQQQQEASDER